MKSKKKYIVFASLVLALSAAVYINWQLSGAKTPKSAKELGAASYVSATASASDDEVQQTAALSNLLQPQQCNPDTYSLCRKVYRNQGMA